MGIISWIILGLIAGFIGSKIVDSEGRRIYIWRIWSVRRYRLERLEHDRRNCRIDRCAADLQYVDG